MKTKKIISNSKYLAPRYWGTWLFILTSYLIAYLPLRIQFIVGGLFGKLLSTNKKLFHVVKTNITACFPELGPIEYNPIIKKYFINQSIDLFETLTIWCRNGYKIVDNQVEVTGLNYLQDALKQNKGIILLASHFGNVDMGAMLMANIGEKNNLFKFSATYREQPNLVFNSFMTRGREQYFNNLIPVNNIRRIAKELRHKKIIWYAPDMNVSKKNAIFIPFLGVQASTTTAISRLAKMTDSIVIPYAHYRSTDKHQYRVEIFPALTNFPSDNIVTDTLKTNKLLEELVTTDPDRYWWILKRFKTRPAGEKSFY